MPLTEPNVRLSLTGLFAKRIILQLVSYHLIPEVAQVLDVVRDSIVMVISNKNLIQFLYYGFQRLSPHVPNQTMDFFAFLYKFLPTGFPLHLEFTVPSMEIVMCKTQKCERDRKSVV